MTLSLSLLESHLWESANILRGPVDAADFKTYIFPLLFFKRICDVWDDEYQEIVDETGDEQLAWFPESHRFQIPEDCHWVDVRAKPSNVGAALQRAMREIEKANPETLYGVFGDAQWSNKERLSDALLKDLIEHFSSLPLGNQNVTSDLLGDAYEYLIKKFADATNKKAGEFYTPQQVSSVLARLVTVGKTKLKSVYDPTCGSGSLLLRVAKEVQEVAAFYGQESNPTTYNLCRMNMIMHDVHYKRFDIKNEDTLVRPQHIDLRFEAIVANPPFSAEWSASPLFMSDDRFAPYGRLAPKGTADLAFVQHMVYQLDEHGTMACVLPHGARHPPGTGGWPPEPRGRRLAPPRTPRAPRPPRPPWW